MGMSTHIRAFIPENDPEYLKHKKVLLVCLESEVSLPKETAIYFGNIYPNKNMLDEKLEIDLEEGIHYKKYNGNYDEYGYEIDLTKLPDGVSKIRFYNSF